MAEATRVAFGRALVSLGEEIPELVVLDADLSCSTNTAAFARRFPDRFYELGVAEGNMVGVAAGLALAGKVPVAASFACFLCGRFEQIRVSVAYNRANVKLVGTHSGLGVGEDGYTQMALEDLALMRALPNLAVVQPCDSVETEQALAYLVKSDGPCYLRLTRQVVEPVNGGFYRFEFGKPVLLREGSDLLLVGSGAVVHPCLVAAEQLAKEGISCAVVNLHTLKPMDGALLGQLAAKCGTVLTVEDHGVVGGVGSAVREALGESGVAVRAHGVEGFGESGPASALYAKNRLDALGIAAVAREIAWSSARQSRARG